MQNVLKHAVGKSTLREGFAVPRDFEDWMGALERGSKRDITLVFDGQKISVTLRRIDNEQGSVQVKYETKAGEPFRLWLGTVFTATLAGSAGEHFEVSRAAADVFEVAPFAAKVDSTPSLHVAHWLFHREADRLFEEDSPLAEIPAVVHAVPFAA